VGIELNPGPKQAKRRWREFFDYNQTMQRRQAERDQLEHLQAKAEAQAQIQAVKKFRSQMEHQQAKAEAQAQMQAVRELRRKKDQETDNKLDGMLSPPVVIFSVQQQMLWKHGK